MFELKITIGTTPELSAALSWLADALTGKAPVAPSSIVTIDGQPIAQAPADQPAPAPVPVNTQPAPAPVPMAQPAAAPTVPNPVPIAQPTAAPNPVPIAQPAAPTYTKEQVAAAGAALIQRDHSKVTELQALLTQFGTPYINALPDEHLGAFATALRQLGADI